jgi:hypothetical protein
MHVMKILAAADGTFIPFANHYVRQVDFDAAGGRGSLKTTPDPLQAKRFRDVDAALRFWNTQSKAVPLRPDGLPNKPLTAFTVTLEPLPH